MNPIGRWRRSLRRRQAQKRLDTIQVAKPCHASWADMAGDEKVRFCAHCRLHVFNLSAMDLEEAANLIAEKDGRLCVRFYRRRDGTTLTQDCPVGVAAWRRRMRVLWASAAGAVATLLGATGLALFSPSAYEGAPINPAPPDSTMENAPGTQVVVGAMKPLAEPTMGLP